MTNQPESEGNVDRTFQARLDSRVRREIIDAFAEEFAVVGEIRSAAVAEESRRVMTEGDPLKPGSVSVLGNLSVRKAPPTPGDKI